jgi:NADH:ubiquinone oxidoreductase subunit E
VEYFTNIIRIIGSRNIKMAIQTKQQESFISEEERTVIDEIIEKNLEIPGSTMVVLNSIQEKLGYVSKEMEAYVAGEMNVPLSVVHGIVTFYSFFTDTPRGKHTIKFCMGTACYVGGMEQLIEKAKQLYGIEPGQTTPDGNVTLEICRCVGACSQAPVVVIDEEIHGRLKPNKFPQLLKTIEE